MESRRVPVYRCLGYGGPGIHPGDPLGYPSGYLGIPPGVPSGGYPGGPLWDTPGGPLEYPDGVHLVWAPRGGTLGAPRVVPWATPMGPWLGHPDGVPWGVPRVPRFGTPMGYPGEPQGILGILGIPWDSLGDPGVYLDHCRGVTPPCLPPSHP